MSRQVISEDAPFSSRTLFWLLLLGLLSTLGIAITSVFQGDGQYEMSPGNNSFSKSAVGHAAFAELITRKGRSVDQSQNNTAQKLNNPDAVLLLIEPRYDSATEKRVSDLLDYAPTLLVLPKRQGFAGGRAGWIGAQTLLDERVPEAVAGFLSVGIDVVRPTDKLNNWRSDFTGLGNPDIDQIQLLTSNIVTPIVSADEGILFGKLDLAAGEPVWILSDPDLLATHGLARGWNAELAVAVMETVAGNRTTAVVDEIIHGFTVDPSLVRAMFKVPFVYATVPALVALLIFMLALTRRFGAPFHVQVSVRDSKAVFINNAARLLHMADKEQEALVRLIEDEALTIAQQLNIPSATEKSSLEHWLDKKSHERGVVPNFTTIKRRALRIRGDEDTETKNQRLLTLAQQFYQWKTEILNEHK